MFGVVPPYVMSDSTHVTGLYMDSVCLVTQLFCQTTSPRLRVPFSMK